MRTIYRLLARQARADRTVAFEFEFADPATLRLTLPDAEAFLIPVGELQALVLNVTDGILVRADVAANITNAVNDLDTTLNRSGGFCREDSLRDLASSVVDLWREVCPRQP
jgi:hypothetical protein